MYETGWSDGYSELKEQEDAKGIIFIMTYDMLGRPFTKTCPEVGMVTTFNTYNASRTIFAKGLLDSTTYSNGTTFSYQYDNFSRITQ